MEIFTFTKRHAASSVYNIHYKIYVVMCVKLEKGDLVLTMRTR